MHFAIIDMSGDLGRIHGSVGVAIQKPRIVLRASRAPDLKAKGKRSERILEYADIILKYAGINKGAEFELVSDIPEHEGFGSGTQLALAVGSAVSQLYDLNLSVEDIALKLNRSRRSGIGTHVFKHGGFVIDGGHKKDKGNLQDKDRTTIRA